MQQQEQATMQQKSGPEATKTKNDHKDAQKMVENPE
jgi:hypothetical protein